MKWSYGEHLEEKLANYFQFILKIDVQYIIPLFLKPMLKELIS